MTTAQLTWREGAHDGHWMLIHKGECVASVMPLKYGGTIVVTQRPVGNMLSLEDAKTEAVTRYCREAGIDLWVVLEADKPVIVQESRRSSADFWLDHLDTFASGPSVKMALNSIRREFKRLREGGNL